MCFNAVESEDDGYVPNGSQCNDGIDNIIDGTVDQMILNA